MFRRTGKNPLEKALTTPLYPEEAISSYKNSLKKEHSKDVAPRLFDPMPQDSARESSIYEEKKASALPHPIHEMLKEEPETTLGEGVVFRGELTFERLLRIDGVFEGELISQGKVIIGPKGRVKAHLNLKEALIEGKIEGNITVEERLELRGDACVCGDIRAKLLSVDEGVSILGNVHVTPPDKS